jgi:predicted DsbA family dithiol-disulfide isomerase
MNKDTEMTISASRPAQPAGESPAVRQLQIDVWGDLACPWCYIGKNRLDQAIASSPHADAITVVTHSFELDPAMSHDVKPNLEVLSAKYGISLAQARAMEDKVVALAQREALPFAVDRVLSNSFDVHRVLHLAGTFGLDDQLLGVLQRTLFGGQANAYDHTVIADAAAQLGIPRHRVEEVLASDEYADAVRADEAEARRIGVTGVPFAVFGGRIAIPGAASSEGYAKAIEQAWDRQ